MTKVSKSKIHDVKLGLIDAPLEFNRLAIDHDVIVELAKSIAEVGLLQPVVLRDLGGRYEMIAGYRRFLAHEYLNLPTIPSRIFELDDTQAAISRATENLARVNLTPIEEGIIYENLISSHEMTVDQIAQRMAISVGVVKRRLDLMKMPPQLRDAIHSGKVNVGVAEELWRISDIGDMEYYLGLAIDNGVTRGVLRGWVDEWAKQQRRENYEGGGGGEISPPYLERPVYVSCDLCQGPMKIGDETVIRSCPECFGRLRNALK